MGSNESVFSEVFSSETFAKNIRLGKNCCGEHSLGYLGRFVPATFLLGESYSKEGAIEVSQEI